MRSIAFENSIGLPIRLVPERHPNSQIGINQLRSSCHDRSELPLLFSFSSALAGIVAETKPAIVSVHSHRSRASGFVWKPGLIVTADEALADEGEVSIKLADGTTRPASIAGRDHTTDIALLRFDAENIAPVTLSSVVPELGSLVGRGRRRARRPHRSARRTVSLAGGRWRSLRGGEIDAQDRARRAAASQPRRAVSRSMPPAKPSAWRSRGATRSCAFPAATIDRVAGRLETHGRIARGYLGVGLQPVKLDDGIGAMVMSVDKIGPIGRRRHPARRRDRRLERRETLRRAFAVADRSGPTASARSSTSRSGAAANRCGSS